MVELKRNLARALRRAPSLAERVLWYRLRRSQVEGCKFRRQAPLGRYIVDFVCLGRRLIVEVDGPFHDEHYDARRDAALRAQGFRVLRFSHLEVINTPSYVVEVVADALRRGPLNARPETGAEMASRLGNGEF